MTDDCDANKEIIQNNDMFRVKVNRIEEENSILREELAKLDEKNVLLERQHVSLKRRLERVDEKYKELQQECDECKVLLDELTLREKTSRATIQKCLKEKRVLLGQLETAELEVQQVSSLKEKLQKLTTERLQLTKRVNEITHTLDERNDECESLRKTVKELEEMNDCLRESCETRENALKVLREKSRRLADENAELKSFLDVDACLTGKQPSSAPDPNTKLYRSVHGTPCESDGSLHQDSLYDELKASVFTNTCDECNTMNRRLEEQVRWYEREISALSKQMGCVFQRLLPLSDVERAPPSDPPNLTSIECPEETPNIETLGKKIQILLDMITSTPSPIIAKGIEVGIQVRADSESMRNLREFSVYDFYEYFKYVFPRNKMIPCSGTVDDNGNAPFLSLKRPAMMKIRPESSVIDPIVEALDEIIRRTANSSSSRKKTSSKEKSSSNRYRSTYALTFHPNTLIPSDREITRANRDILTGDGNDPLRTQPVITRGSSQFSPLFATEGERSKIMYQGCRRSKSESSLVIGKRPPFSLRYSCNVTVVLSPEKANEALRIRDVVSVIDSLLKDQELGNIGEAIADDVPNLTCWHGFKFGHTYRCLSDDTTSSSFSSSSSSTTTSSSSSLLANSSSFRRNDPRSLGDFSLDDPCHRPSAFTLAPTRLTLSSNKSIDSDRILINDTKRNEPDDRPPKLDKFTFLRRNEDRCILVNDKIHFFSEIAALRSSSLNNGSDYFPMDIDNKVYSIGGETCSIDESTVAPHDETSVSSQRLFSLHLQGLSETDRPAVHSTPLRFDIRNKNRTPCNERARDTPLVDVLFDDETFTCGKRLMKKRCDWKFAKSDVAEEYILDELRCAATVESIQDCTDEIRANARETATDTENRTHGVAKSNLAKLYECFDYSSQSVRIPDTLKEMGRSLEENNNVSPNDDIYIPTLTKSDTVSNNVCGSPERSTDLFQRAIDAQRKLRPPPVYRNLQNILIIPSWRVIVSYGLVFILGYHVNNLLSSNCIYAEPPYMSWSLEEMFNRYFPIRDTGRLAPI